MLYNTLKAKHVFIKGEEFSRPILTAVRKASPIHNHDFYELFYVVNGEMLHHVNGYIQRLVCGDVVFMRPSDVHYFNEIGSNTGEFVNIAFSGEFLKRICVSYNVDIEKLLHEKIMLPYIDNFAANTLEVLGLMHNRVNVFSNMGGQCKRQVKAFLNFVFSNVFAQTENVHFPEWLYELCSKLSQPQNFIKGTDAVKELCYYSYEHVIRSFKRHVGVTPSQYILNLRLDHAFFLLSQGDLPILEISLECGFSSHSYFCREFKKKYDKTPNIVRHE